MGRRTARARRRVAALSSARRRTTRAVGGDAGLDQEDHREDGRVPEGPAGGDGEDKALDDDHGRGEESGGDGEGLGLGPEDEVGGGEDDGEREGPKVPDEHGGEVGREEQVEDAFRLADIHEDGKAGGDEGSDGADEESASLGFEGG